MDLQQIVPETFALIGYWDAELPRIPVTRMIVKCIAQPVLDPGVQGCLS